MIADHFHFKDCKKIFAQFLHEPSLGVRPFFSFFPLPICLRLSRELLLCERTNERTVVQQTVNSLNCHSFDPMLVDHTSSSIWLLAVGSRDLS